MITTPKYNPKTDLAKHRPSLSIDLSIAVRTGEIKGDATDVEFNDLDTDKIYGRVTDTFEAIDVQKTMLAQAQNNVQTSQPATGESE